MIANGLSRTAADARYKTVEPFIAPTLLNSWVNFVAGFRAALYFKTPQGMVNLLGLIKNGSAATLFVLPVGYRPSASLRFVVSGTSAFAQIDIASDGTVALSSSVAGASSALSLAGISFLAEQ